MKILLVDDDRIFLRLTEHALQKAGHEIHTARNGVDAELLLHSHEINLVITDWEMPVMNGIELCRRIRSGTLDRYVYTILLTSHSDPDSVVEGLDSGADDFISKPFREEELNVRIKAAQRLLGLEMRDMAIFMMAKLAESRDPDTGQHLERVQRYSRVLAEELANQGKYRNIIDADYMRLIYQTSPLHDIGKVGTPDHILLKPGKLTAEEFEIMKQHTTLGAETLDQALEMYPQASFLMMARDIAAGHHEKFDGTGYPLGLSGEQIPLCARIVSLADVYDALTSVRVYKKRFSHEQTRRIIVEASGTQFDPDVVSAFLRAQHRFEKIKIDFNDEGEYADELSQSSDSLVNS